MNRLERLRRTKMKTTKSGKIMRNPREIAQTKKMKVMMRNLKTQKILDRKTPSWRPTSNNKLRRKEECSQCSTRTRNDKCKPGIKSLKIRNHVERVMKVRQTHKASTYKISALPASNSTHRISSIS